MKQAQAPPHNDNADVQAGVYRRWLHRLVEPAPLMAILTLVIVAIVWGAAFKLAEQEELRAEQAAAEHVPELAQVYEARVLRALRQVDHTLDLVRYSLASTAPERVLDRLGSQGLLPLEVIFDVSIMNADGDVVATTATTGEENVARRRYFRQALDGTGLVIGQPRFSPELEEWRLSFSRGLRDASTDFTGVVAVSVPANYFVSGYQDRVLGDDGVLAIVGTDGVIRARNSGGEISAGKRISYNQLIRGETAQSEAAPARVNQWDRVSRYTTARKLHGYPLAIVTGLSRTEQLAPVADLRATYYRRASAVTLIVAIVMTLLARLMVQLQKTRTRVTEERLSRAQAVEYLAFHDELTQLPNRAFFSNLLQQEIQQSHRYNKKLALLFLDLDGFKSVNDTQGHEAGDDLLKEMARRLQITLRDSDVIGRLGGDEFVIMLPEVGGDTDPAFVAEKILAAVDTPFALGGRKFRISVSIGIALFPDDSLDEATLMKNADTAMYHAKEHGKDNFRFFSEELNQDSVERLALESGLRKALDRDQFRLVYQAKRDMQTGQVLGVEALLRWDHPDHGVLEPGDFLPQAEENGLIVSIGRWVLTHACKQNRDWQTQGCAPLVMAVNLSYRQFMDNHLVQDVREALNESGMAPELLELEITEGMLIPDMEHALALLGQLKALGVRIAIDDFGSAYSSLSSLRDFPLDTIKIDPSWIQDLAGNRDNQSLTEAVITLGRNLSLTVVAEGVESGEQAQYLQSRMCEQFQGFYVDDPVEANTVPDGLAPAWPVSRTSGTDG